MVKLFYCNIVDCCRKYWNVLLFVHSKKFNHGFTLIELLIVVALFAIAAVGGSGMFISLIRNNEKSTSVVSLKREGETVLTAISRELYWGKNIEKANPNQCDGVTTFKTVQFVNVDDVLVTVICDEAAKQVTFRRGIGSDVSLINPANISGLSNCEMTCTESLGRYNFQFSFDLSNAGASETFSMNTTLRNSQL